MRAVAAGLDCDQCRKEFADGQMDPPCDSEILPDGTCRYGMPDLLPESRMAVRLYGDIKALGWSAARDLNDLRLTDTQRSDLLTKLRVIAGEWADIEREQAKAASEKGG